MAEGCGAIAQFWLDVIENLRSAWDGGYLFYLSGWEKGALGNEYAILEQELLVGASHICFQSETVTDILLIFLL